MKYSKNKGFTLIEILGVIVIMGLIMMVVIPTLSQMIHDNDNKAYKNYYDLIEEGSRVYASKLTDSLGTSQHTGCKRITLAELIDKGYVQKYNDTSVSCTTPNDITIRNEKGNIKVKFRLLCNNENGETVYNSSDDDNQKVEDKGECEVYKVKEEINLKIKVETTIEAANKRAVGSDVYIIGTPTNNYVWYSGKMWRIISYNKINETVKAVTVNPMTSIYFNNNGTKNYTGSDVETWLNNDFLNSLKDPASFITNNNYPVNATTTKSKVALISKTDFEQIKTWYGKASENSWTIEGSVVTATNASITSTPDSKTLQAVRPVVTFSSDVLVHEGSGTTTSPFIVDGSSNSVGAVGEPINTRYSGEYIKMADNKMYRIISTDGTTTKVIGLYNFDNTTYSDNHFDYVSSNLRTTLEAKYNATMKAFIDRGDYCLDTINSGDALAYRSSKCLTADRVNNSITVGVPKIGEMFTTTNYVVNTSGNVTSIIGEYWTLNPNTENSTGNNDGYYNATINTILPAGSSLTRKITEQVKVVPVFYLKETVTIAGGKGTPNNPYTLN